MKKRSSRLQVVLNLAQQRKAQAEQFLGEQVKRVETDKAQLAQLQGYLAEYQQAYREAVNRGLDVGQLQNYQAFMAKISDAIEKHRKAMKHNLEQLEQVKKYWAQMHGKHQAVDSLVSKVVAQEKQVEDKQLQKLLDERSQLRPSSFI